MKECIVDEKQLKELLVILNKGSITTEEKRYGIEESVRGKGAIATYYPDYNTVKLWPSNSWRDEVVSFDEFLSFFSVSSKKGVGVCMATMVTDTLVEDVAVLFVESAKKVGVKVDANRPYSKANHMAKLENGVLSFGSGWTKTHIIDDVLAALSKPSLLFGRLPATVEGNNIVVDYEGTKFTITKKRLKEALTWVEGFSEQSYNVGVVTKKSGDTVVPVGLQVGCQLVSVEQLRELVK